MDLQIFNWGHAVVSSDYLDQMPFSLEKEAFFKGVGISEMCESILVDDCVSFKGLWKNILNVQKALEVHLQEWEDKQVGDRNLSVSLKESDPVPLRKVKSVRHPSSASLKILNSILVDPKPSPKVQESTDLPDTDSETCVVVIHNCDQLAPVDPESSEKRKDNSKPLTPCSIGQTVLVLESDNHVNETALFRKDKYLRNSCTLERSDYDVSPRNSEQSSGSEISRFNDIVENEIYMDIKLSKKPEDPNVPLTLVVATEDAPEGEVLQLHLDSSMGKKERAERAQGLDEKEKLLLAMSRKKKYEEEAPYKFYCTQCSFKTKRESHFKKHAQLHERVCKLYSCNSCDFTTLCPGSLRKHCIIHNKQLIRCAHCPYLTDEESLLFRHQKKKHGKKKMSETPSVDIFQCSECSYMTSSEKYMQRHMIVHTKRKGSLKNFKCDKCSYQCPSRSNYYRHLSSMHGDERNFLCKVCGLRFKRSDTLKQHAVTHAETSLHKEAFQCLKCKKFYRSQKHLDEHALTHSNDRNYLCEVCGMAFKTRSVQVKHMKSVHKGVKSFECSHCPKKFSGNFTLKRHLKVHTLQEAQRRERRIPAQDDKSLESQGGQQDEEQAECQIEPQTEHQSKSQRANTSEWCDSLVTVPGMPEDVQVLVVQPDQTQSEIVLDQDAIMMHNGSLLQVAQPGVSGQATLSFPFPVEYILPQVTPHIGPTSGAPLTQAGTQMKQVSSQGGDFITLTFV